MNSTTSQSESQGQSSVPGSRSIAAPTARIPRVKILQGAAKYIPSTQDGLPAGFYRADLIPGDCAASEAQLPSTTEAAFVPLNYQEGFPALPDGRPFWHKMDYEPPQSFMAFELFVGLSTSGPRYLAALLESSELQRVYGSNLNMDLLQELHTLYYWRERARAYDLYQAAAYRHLRTRRAQQMEDYQYIKSTALLERVMEQLEKPETFDIMKHDPQLLISAMEKLMKIQRVSVGLPALAPPESMKGEGGAGGTAPTTFEMILRQMTSSEGSRDTNSANSTLDNAGNVISSTDNLLRGALNNPETAHMMQELIIRMSMDNGATKTPRWAGKADVNDAFEDVDPNEGDSRA